MNSKRAKRLRQLVRHLMQKGGVPDAPWEVVKNTEHRVRVESETVNYEIHDQRVLDLECGKSVYRMMKDRVNDKAQPTSKS